VHVFLHDTRLFFEHLAAVDFGALAIACGLQALRLTLRTAAWRNIIAAAYPERSVRWLSVLGAYLAGVGLNAVTPARSGDALKLYLVKHRVEGSTYPTLAATLIVETMFDALVGSVLLLWALHLGVFPSLHALPNLPNVDWRWPLRHPRALEIGVPLLLLAVAILLAWVTERVAEFWQHVAQGFAIVREPRDYLVGVVPWQALSWVCRLAAIFWLLRAFHIDATVRNALLVQVAQSLSTLLPITPGGAGTEQGLLLYLFRGKAARTALLSFSVGAHIAIVFVNVVLGLAAILLMTRSLRLGRLRSQAEASRDPERAEVRDGVAGSPPP
jgi:glycosyltransferase 2 family protein